MPEKKAAAKKAAPKKRKPQPLDKRLAKAVDNVNALMDEAYEGGQEPVMALTRKPGRKAMKLGLQFGGLQG